MYTPAYSSFALKKRCSNMSRTSYPDTDKRPCSILLEMCQNVVRRRIKNAHKIKDQLNVSNRKSCHVYM